ncbi:MAG: 50S ribosomal protein L16 3-hydroxylase [Polyangiales bacterium]|jgi:50S ribosomal protein L16 3-hydroxylase
MQNLFDQLIPSSQRKAFLNSFEKNKVLCIHDLKSLNKTFQSIPFLESFDHLISTWRFDVDVHLADLRDEQKTKTRSSAEEALIDFRRGQSLLFNDVNKQEPALENWLEDTRKSLKLSAHTFSRCLVYATPKDGGNAPHFDQNINFVLQLSGEKTWWAAENDSVINPLHRHVIGQEIHPELESYMKAPMPESFPEQSERFDLKPGSLLFVPPGVWHKTKASSDAVSLNFTFSPPSLLDLVTLALRGRLTRSEVWREQAVDLENPEQIEKLDFLIQHLAGDMQTWSARDLLGALEG